MRTRRLLASWLAVWMATAGAAGCRSATRPRPEPWRVRWEDARTLVPEAAAFEGDDPRERCDAILVGVRRARRSLLPTYDPALDAPVRAWIEAAGDLGFDCPAAKGQPEALRDSLAELRLLESEIEAALGSPAA